MTLFERILCAIDFDGNSHDALHLAGRLAQREEGALTVLHVVRPTDPLVVSAPVLAQHREDEARAELTRVAARDLAAIAHQTLLRCGDPSDEILKAAQEIRADLIVMATHGRHGLAHMMLGSVAEKVVRAAGCPVLTVRMGEPHAAHASTA